jgi:predicted phosphodiesterase
MTEDPSRPVLDLGRLGNDPLLIFGGPYGNLQALHALKAEAAYLNIPPRRTICTGDLAAYGADPQDVAEVVREWGIAVVRGNVEEQLAAGAGDCGCGFDEGSACDSLSQRWYSHCLEVVSDDVRAWMGTLPATVRFVWNGRAVAIVHGGVTQTNRFLFESDDQAEFVDEFAVVGADIVLAGHSGLPFARCLGPRLWINAGVIGLPANDGTADGWYALLRRDGDGITASFLRLNYDHATAAARTRAAQLPEGYADAMETGLWPSLDVLPPTEKAATGKAIEEWTIRFP